LVYNEKVFAPAQISSGGLSLDEVKKMLEENLPQVYSCNVDKVVREITGDIMSVNIYMLGFALSKGVLPFEKDAVWGAIQEKIAERFWSQNRKVFEAASTV
jgi:Pyruvate/2-oxoacid:ferredoxin oxidoreductase gamma subunit